MKSEACICTGNFGREHSLPLIKQLLHKKRLLNCCPMFKMSTKICSPISFEFPFEYFFSVRFLVGKGILNRKSQTVVLKGGMVNCSSQSGNLEFSIILALLFLRNSEGKTAVVR